MRNIVYLRVLLFVGLASALASMLSSPARAQSLFIDTWVSGIGSDSHTTSGVSAFRTLSVVRGRPRCNHFRRDYFLLRSREHNFRRRRRHSDNLDKCHDRLL